MSYKKDGETTVTTNHHNLQPTISQSSTNYITIHTFSSLQTTCIVFLFQLFSCSALMQRLTLGLVVLPARQTVSIIISIHKTSHKSNKYETRKRNEKRKEKMSHTHTHLGNNDILMQWGLGYPRKAQNWLCPEGQAFAAFI